MITDRLKNETKEAHQALEHFLIPRIKGAGTMADYISLLKVFYGYFHPVEHIIDTQGVAEILTDYNGRRKAELLLNDIKAAVPHAETELRECCDLPTIATTAQALGAMYVLEGSTLGGTVIARMLQKGPAAPADEMLSFFNGYGADTQARWHAFTLVLNNYATAHNNEAEIIAAAQETFVKFKNWVQEN